MRGLYIITPDWDDTQRLLDATEQAILGGATMVQYRHKTATESLRHEQASALLELSRRFNVPLMINDYVSLCIDLDADGVHVGGTDASVAEVRRRLGSDKLVGASCYGSLALAHTAAEEGASYLAFGGFYPSRVKKYDVTTPLNIVTQVKQRFKQPIVVIGGMTLDNCVPLVELGADSVAVISAVYGASDIRGAAKTFGNLYCR
jgi:thiamine-phosphate pyrophosphorylase